jgi:hypothetical protein
MIFHHRIVASNPFWAEALRYHCPQSLIMLLVLVAYTENLMPPFMHCSGLVP